MNAIKKRSKVRICCIELYCLVVNSFISFLIFISQLFLSLLLIPQLIYSLSMSNFSFKILFDIFDNLIRNLSLLTFLDFPYQRYGGKKRSSGGFERDHIMEFFEGCNALSTYAYYVVRTVTIIIL